MKGQQPISPRKYIETRVRSLPLYKCWATPGWEKGGITQVIVARRHTNGHLTAGVYLVDLFCLGVKDTFFIFNEEEEVFAERLSLNSGMLQEISYPLAHNLIYAGHDFAMEFDIHPHKDFLTTRYILEEDTDDIPLIDVHTGDENGNPHLFVSSDYNYRPVLEKLKKYAGEGAYTFTLESSLAEEFDDELEEEGEDWSLDDIEPNFVEFTDVRDAADIELHEALQSSHRSLFDKCIVTIELVLRQFSDTDPGWYPLAEEVTATEDFRLFLESPAWEEKDEDEIAVALFKELVNAPGDNEITENETKTLFVKFRQYVHRESTALFLLNVIPLKVISDNWEEILQQWSTLPLLVRSTLFMISVVQKLPVQESHVQFIEQSKTAVEAFAEEKEVTDLHYRIFWIAKVMLGIQQDNKAQVQRYHSLVSHGELPPGRLKFLYALLLTQYLRQELKKEEENGNTGR